MPNYQQGKIYKIVRNIDDDICYVGSTTLPLLCQRMVEHRKGYRRWKNGKGFFTTSYKLFEKYGVENCRIELIEIFHCNTKDELTKKEGEWIRNLNCVNKHIPNRTRQEYYEDNRDTLLEYKKEYYEVNRGSILEKNKEYREVNRGSILEYKKEYREVNKDTIAEKGKIKYTCVCGSTLRKDNKIRHEKTLIHINYCASVSVVP